MVLPDGRVLAKIELARPRIAKDQLYPVLHLLGGFMLLLPNRLQDFDYIFCSKLRQWFFIQDGIGIAFKRRGPSIGMFGIGSAVLVCVDVALSDI